MLDNEFVLSGSPWSCTNLLWIIVWALSTETDVNNTGMSYEVEYSPGCDSCP